MSNPFTPRRHRAASPAPAASPPISPSPTRTAAVSSRPPLPPRAQLEDMRKAALQDLATTRGVQWVPDDTRAELIAALEATR